ncbi:MAG TPA: aminoglycoside phosphotransferase family protein [Streptosporangiaceae bacterium]|nr:aminoglycoside phosphotransferase family protein [Streptosporangiaceae bacterium]
MTQGGAPGRLIGSGRAADVYELGRGRVLRRYRTAVGVADEERLAAHVAREARLMEYLWSVGFPVPQVIGTDGADMIMARVDGVDLLSDLARRPWRARVHASTLARMHDQLHKIEAPSWLPRPFGQGAPGRVQSGTGDRILHLDLHPGNVMLTPAGPVVIDWSNGSAGPPGADVAMASLIMRISEVDDLPVPVRLVAGMVRGTVVRQFERSVSDDPGPHFADVAKSRLHDRNVRPSEIAILRRMLDGQAWARR